MEPGAGFRDRHPPHFPEMHVGGVGGAHGGTIDLQPLLLKLAHWAPSTFARALSTAVLPVAATARVHESKQDALSPTWMQSASFVHVRFASIAAPTSFDAEAVSSLHEDDALAPPDDAPG